MAGSKQIVLMVVLLLATLTQLGLFNYHWVVGCHWQLQDAETQILLLADPQMEGNRKIEREGWAGKLDVMFNDLYSQHVFRTAQRLQRPTHTIVLGDVFSSEFILAPEFSDRVRRFRAIYGMDSQPEHPMVVLAGNHDIGYGAIMEEHHVGRFEEAFGPVNSILEIGGHRFVKINSMNVDSSRNKKLEKETEEFIRRAARLQKKAPMPLILLTHIPLHKPAGSCVDAPMIEYTYTGQVLRQNMLSDNASSVLLDSLQPKVVFSGHDHEGCRYVHRGSVPEYTVRSAMAEYGGNSALFEMKRLSPTEFEYAYMDCPFMDHIALKIVLVASLVLQLASLVGLCLTRGKGGSAAKKQKTS